MQKLVTIYLNDNERNSVGVREDHLQALLSDGWKVVSLVPVGAGVSHSADAIDHSGPMRGYVAGWLAVLLEK